jgi:hypothetical protein
MVGARRDGKAMDQYLGNRIAATDPKTADGIGVSDNSGRQQQRNYPRR